ncbi:MAG: DUF1552 domain-containing protein [Steroidobacteraceae bacterium]
MSTSRRGFLRGTFAGSAVAVGLPFLDCFLNESGTALAGTGQPLPSVFGNWFQYLGLNPGRWVPDQTGSNYKNKVELAMFDPWKERVNLISGGYYHLDGRPVETHKTGVQIATLGGIPSGRESGASLDSDIADIIGRQTRFQTLDVTGTGGRFGVSKRAGAAYKPVEASPAALYRRIFGPDFKDPNAAEFVPSTKALAKASVLSQVSDQRRAVLKAVGASDRARLDEYFTSLRQLEKQVAMQLEPPEPLPACKPPPSVAPEADPGAEVTAVERNIDLFTSLLIHAVTCGQTRVFNVTMNTQGCRKAGSTQTWHGYTHEEPIDDALGYQPETTWFIMWANQLFANFLGKLEATPEGAGSVLDRMLVLWQTDHGYARTHTMDNVTTMTVGNAGGLFLTGRHIALAGDPVTRVGLTVQQGFGVRVSAWGSQSNRATRPITDMLV